MFEWPRKMRLQLGVTSGMLAGTWHPQHTIKWNNMAKKSSACTAQFARLVANIREKLAQGPTVGSGHTRRRSGPTGTTTAWPPTSLNNTGHQVLWQPGLGPGARSGRLPVNMDPNRIINTHMKFVVPAIQRMNNTNLLDDGRRRGQRKYLIVPYTPTLQNNEFSNLPLRANFYNFTDLSVL